MLRGYIGQFFAACQAFQFDQKFHDALIEPDEIFLHAEDVDEQEDVIMVVGVYLEEVDELGQEVQCGCEGNEEGDEDCYHLYCVSHVDVVLLQLLEGQLFLGNFIEGSYYALPLDYFREIAIEGDLELLLCLPVGLHCTEVLPVLIEHQQEKEKEWADQPEMAGGCVCQHNRADEADREGQVSHECEILHQHYPIEQVEVAREMVDDLGDGRIIEVCEGGKEGPLDHILIDVHENGREDDIVEQYHHREAQRSHEYEIQIDIFWLGVIWRVSPNV